MGGQMSMNPMGMSPQMGQQMGPPMMGNQGGPPIPQHYMNNTALINQFNQNQMANNMNMGGYHNMSPQTNLAMKQNAYLLQQQQQQQNALIQNQFMEQQVTSIFFLLL